MRDQKTEESKTQEKLAIAKVLLAETVNPAYKEKKRIIIIIFKTIKIKGHKKALF